MSSFWIQPAYVGFSGIFAGIEGTERIRHSSHVPPLKFLKFPKKAEAFMNQVYI